MRDNGSGRVQARRRLLPHVIWWHKSMSGAYVRDSVPSYVRNDKWCKLIQRSLRGKNTEGKETTGSGLCSEVGPTVLILKSEKVTRR